MITKAEYISEKRKRKRCCICRSNETYIKSDGNPDWRSCRCGKKNCTRYLCKKCSCYSLWRNGQLDPFSSTGTGFIGQQIVAKTYGVEDCNLSMNNFNFYVDLSIISEYGYSEVKTATLNIKNGKWEFSSLANKDFDTAFLVCMDGNKPWKDVERIYAIPWEAAIKRSSIAIVKDPSRCTWYDNLKRGYRLGEIPFNDIYHSIDWKKCKVLKWP